MQEFKFEIPSTCIEVVTVKAETIEEAAQIVVDGGDYETSVEEMDFSIPNKVEHILEYKR